MPTGYEDVDEEAGAIETREEACAVQPHSRVALGLPGKMTLADPRETASSESRALRLPLLSVQTLFKVADGLDDRPEWWNFAEYHP
jgi:hypothetical protein